MAQIINKRTPEIMANRRPTGLSYISVTDKLFYFPKTVSHLVGIKEGLFIHFINDNEYWAFYINEDPDGFPFNQDKPGSYRVTDRALVKMFLRSVKKDKKSRFFITESGAKQNGFPVFEIYTKDTVDVVLDKERSLREMRKRVLNTVRA